MAAGFALFVLGTESDGSMISPSECAALHGLKGALGSMNTLGTKGVAPPFDCLGETTKSPQGVANEFNILQHGKYFSSNILST